MQPKREHSVHVRLSDEADAMLELMCQVHGHDKAKIAADLLHEALFGKGHALKVIATRLTGAGFAGSARE
jgi:hypothetical protein